MNIELNKAYKTREGHTVIIIDVNYSRSRPFFGRIDKGSEKMPASFFGNGQYSGGKESVNDIIEELKVEDLISTFKSNQTLSNYQPLVNMGIKIKKIRGDVWADVAEFKLPLTNIITLYNVDNNGIFQVSGIGTF
jgi:hypothetical protein